ncbi:MAG: hypothetical protein M1833_003589 [Piccolia ochrophora]|nr:MAG: hypothetical protein M1833_003589 [Piccolia ochrophora]
MPRRRPPPRSSARIPRNPPPPLPSAAPTASDPADADPHDEVSPTSATTKDFPSRLQQYAYQSPTSTPPRPSTTRKRPRSAISPPTLTNANATTTTPSPSAKKRRKPSGYAPPSTYAHLPHLTDKLAPSLLILFVGLNPGIRTATTGHAYSHPTNLFWRLLHAAGITPRRCEPREDVDLPRLFGLGNTNIVARPTRDGAELSRAEMVAGYDALEDKVGRWRPEVVCLVGKAIWESVWQARYGRKMKVGEFRYGWQGEGERMGKGAEGEEWEGARVFVATTTSGLAATLKPHEKEAIWKPLGEWVIQRRKERGQWLGEESGAEGERSTSDA